MKAEYHSLYRKTQISKGVKLREISTLFKPNLFYLGSLLIKVIRYSFQKLLHSDGSFNNLHLWYLAVSYYLGHSFMSERKVSQAKTNSEYIFISIVLLAEKTDFWYSQTFSLTIWLQVASNHHTQYTQVSDLKQI